MKILSFEVSRSPVNASADLNLFKTIYKTLTFTKKTNLQKTKFQNSIKDLFLRPHTKGIKKCMKISL